MRRPWSEITVNLLAIATTCLTFLALDPPYKFGCNRPLVVRCR